MANISLEKSVRTCKVDVGWANKLESDRFLNPNTMLCSPWNGYDTSGRPVSFDSYYTKTPGCNSAGDRVIVENDLRPQYIEYVNLDASGIRGGQQCGYNTEYADAMCHQKQVADSHNYTGQFGYNTGFSQNIHANCQTCQSGIDPSSYNSQVMRNNQYMKQGNRSFQNRNSGFDR